MKYSWCLSQNNIDAIEIIHNTIKESQDTNRIFYEDSLLTQNTYVDIIKSLTKRTYSSILKANVTNTFQITRKEHRYILANLNCKELKFGMQIYFQTPK